MDESYQEIRAYLIRVIIRARSQLMNDWSKERRESPNPLSGSCIDACLILQKMIPQDFRSIKHTLIRKHTLEEIHGELRHCQRIPSKYWPIQHSLLKVTLDGFDKEHDQQQWVFYVDITYHQFESLFDMGETNIIMDQLPWWLYPDDENPRFRNKIARWIDNHIHFRGLTPVTFFQYKVCGFISDFMRKRKNGNKVS